MKKMIAVVLTLAFALSAIPIGVAGCATGKPVDLGGVEISEYQGKDLSSVNDFRENSINGPQYIDKGTYKLKVTGVVRSPKEYTYEQVVDKHKLYQKVVTLNCVEGWSVTIFWEGVLLKDLLAEAQPLPDAKVIIFHAYDGYTTSEPVDYIMGNDSNIIMAHKMNGLPIPPERGYPFVLVAESKWGYKWAKWITEIEFSDDANYRGYWESRGYSNTGDLDKWYID